MTGSDWGGTTETISVAATPLADGAGVPQSIRGSAASKKEADAERAANRLRKAGYSYRRIAETLKIPYITVSRWLSGDLGIVRKPPTPAPLPLRIKADPGDVVPAEVTESGEPAPALPSPPSPERGTEDGDVAHRLEVLQLQFTAFEGYTRSMAEDFNRNRKELLDSQAKAVEDMERERDAISLARKGFETAIARFDNRFDEMAQELRGELEALKANVQGELAAIRDQIAELRARPATAAGAVATATAASTDDPFGASTDDPFGASTDDPFGASKDDPFGATKEDPFGTKDDPFGAGGKDDDPFAAAAKDDPFGSAKDDPFGSADDDPFAAAVKDDNPFGGDDEDPFGGDDDPFGAGDNPFGSSDNPFGGAGEKHPQLN